MEFNDIALEQMSRATVEILYDNLNTQIDNQNSIWIARDNEFFTHVNRTNLNIAAEHVDPSNLFYGHIPSLIDAPIERYPNVSVMTFNVIPVAGEDDSMEEYALRMAIEIMVKSDAAATDKYSEIDDDTALIVNSRLLRTVSAVRECLADRSNRNLNNTVPKFGNTPIMNIGDVWAAKVDRGHQARFFWQGARLEYRINQWVAYQ